MNGFSSKLFALLVALVGLTSSSRWCWAVYYPGISFTTADYSGAAESGYSLGFDFTPTTNLVVTHLGFYDREDDGLTASHDVGIFRVSDQSLIAATTVLPTDTLHIGKHWYHEIPAITLAAGTTYRIAAVVTPAEGFPYQNYDGPNLKPESHPDIVLGNGFYTPTNSLVFPTTEPFIFWYGAPNFLNNVPEPSVAMLLGLGGWMLWRRRR